MSLIVTGTIGIDTVHTPDEQAEGVLGGSCAYFAAAAALQGPVRIVGAVGDDWPAEHRAVLEGIEQIGLAGLECRSGSTTFRWGGRYFDDMNQRETLFTELGVLEEAPPAVPEAYADSRYIFLGNTHPVVQTDMLAQFPDRALAVADTMDLWINVAHEELLALLKQLDGVVLNDGEAALLTECRNQVTAARKIIEMGPRFVVVKKGEHGSILVHRDEGVAVLPAWPAELHQVLDPTGAGDSFAGGMMARLALLDRTDLAALRTAIAWGTVTASFTLESFGLDGLTSITGDDVAQRLEKFRTAMHVE